MTLRDRPAYRLTQHFFNGFFDLGFLSDAGTDAFKRMILGICTALFTFGLLLLRVFAAKYVHLSTLESPERYRQALLADHAFLMALPMWIVAFVTVLVGHALFPDETDFRVLMALPVTRRLIFGAKLAALALFTGLFVVAVHIALAPLAALTLVGRWAEHAFVWEALAYVTASLLASGFAVLAVTAVHGALVVGLPRGRLLATSAVVRSLLLCALVLSLPLLLRLPAQARAFRDGAWWLTLAPPAWFAGLERWILGDGRPRLVELAGIAGTAVIVAIVLAVGLYAMLYRHFDRVMVRAEGGSAPSDRRLAWARRLHRSVRRPGFAAVRTFTLITLRRSVLHQGIVVALSAAGVGLVVNSLIAAGLPAWIAGSSARMSVLVSALVWAPFVLIFAGVLAVRMAFMVPTEPRANWVFRVTEQDTARADQLRAAAATVGRLGVILPIALLAPLDVLVLGRDTLPAVAITLLSGWLFVELVMRNWARVPFTCSYLPGKRFVPQAILLGLGSFLLFTTLGTALVHLSVVGATQVWTVGILLGAAALLLRWRRLKKWRDITIEFEDTLPTEVNPLRLSVD